MNTITNSSSTQDSFFKIRNITIAATGMFAVFSSNAIAASDNEMVSSNITMQNISDTETITCSENTYVFTPQKSYRGRYKKIVESKWFNRAYNDMTVGDVILIEE